MATQDQSVYDALNNMSTEELEQLSKTRDEDPSLFSKVMNGFKTAATRSTGVPAAVGTGLANAASQAADVPGAVATGAITAAKRIGPALEKTAEQSAQLEATPEPGARVVNTDTGEIYNKPEEAAPVPSVADTQTGGSLAQDQIDSADQKAKELVPAVEDPKTSGAVLQKGAKDFQQMQVSDAIYKKYLQSVDQALQDYRAEVKDVKRAQLWTAIAQAVGMLAIAATTTGYAGGPEHMQPFAKVDFESDLMQASRNLDAVRTTEKTKLEEQQRQTGEQRAVANLTQDEEKVAASKEERDLRREERGQRQIEQANEKKQKLAQARTDKAVKDYTKRKDLLVTEINKTLDNKKLSDDEKIARMNEAVVKSQLPISKRTLETITKKSGLIWKSLDKEDVTNAVEGYLSKEANPYLELLKNGVVTMTKGGLRKEVPAAHADELKQLGWKVEGEE